MILGLAYDLKSDILSGDSDADDALEEYDSEETVDCIADALASLGHTVVRLGGGKAFLTAVLSHTMDLVFNIAEGRGTYRSREVQVPAVLEMLNIPYIGSDPACLAVCLDKPLAKHLAASAGIGTPRWQLAADRHVLDGGCWSGFTFPVFVKPAWEGSSKGIGITSRANSVPEMERSPPPARPVSPAGAGGRIHPGERAYRGHCGRPAPGDGHHGGDTPPWV